MVRAGCVYGGFLWQRKTSPLEADSIRSRAESTGGCVRLKAVTDTRQSGARDTLTADSAHLLLNASKAVD